MQFASQPGIPQPMYYATPGGQTIYQAGGQSYLLAQPGTTTTGAPAIYAAGPALHNGASQQSQSALSQQSQQQQQQLAYQMLGASTAGNVPTGQQQASAGLGVVAQQAAQLVQRPGVLSQVRHHPYRN